MTRHTKIVCTIGPASSSAEMLKAMMQAGMDVARLNTSHGTIAEHLDILATVREVAAAEGRHIAVLMDLGGPKVRTRPSPDGQPYDLAAGETVYLVSEAATPARGKRVVIDYPHLTRDLEPGDHVLINDGNIDLRVSAVGAGTVKCNVVQGGLVGAGKGVNFPNTDLSVPPLTPRDVEAIEAGVAAGVDLFALSFVNDASDIEAAREVIASHGADIPIIAKIERRPAVANLDSILADADGVMVARGDLGVEMATEEVPILQRRIVEGASRAMIPVITATQMLESMVDSPRPTRAEASDVANAVWEYADALMLSAETAIGRFPVQSVSMMDRIIRRAEAAGSAQAAPPGTRGPDGDDHPRIVALAARRIVETDPNMQAIVCFTNSGYTAFLASKQRVACPIYAITPSDAVARRLCLARSVISIQSPTVDSLEEMMEAVDHLLIDGGHVASGEEVTLIASLPVKAAGTTNFLKLHRLGEATVHAS